jgi:hypothetical protein
LHHSSFLGIDTFERMAILLASSTYRLLRGTLPLIASVRARDIRIVMRLFAIPLTSLLLIRLLATGIPFQLVSKVNAYEIGFPALGSLFPLQDDALWQ